MERENFYILLELAIDPPETDPKTIEAALSRKQAEWSRLRNHPSKGLQAQKNIILIPEIRRVMSDAKLRAQELKAALASRQKDKESKHTEIDRHIELLMGKGFISREEVIKLAQVHDLNENEIQTRVNARKNQKFIKIDQQISLRIAKGYVTEGEIERLARRHGITPDEIKSRIHCPIRKNDKESGEPPRQIDRSIEKAIRENLKIIGRTSLYDFLGLPESASLENLQEASTAKKQELATIGRKDADLTASNTLAGHCVTIFKSPELRIAYDVSLATGKLAELDSDIEISAMSGKILPEYFGILVKKAIDFGMERDEAEAYIKGYCKRKNLRIETPQVKRRKYVIAGAVAAVLILVAASVGFLYHLQRQADARTAEFNSLVEKTGPKQPAENAIQLLREYTGKHREDKKYDVFVRDAEKRIETLRIRAGENGFAAVMENVGKAANSGDYAAAKMMLSDYLKTAPPGDFARKANAEILEMNKQIETRDFESVSRVMIEGRADEKIEAIDRYREAHPGGVHIGQVDQMLKDLANEYHIFVKTTLDALEALEKWEACAELAQGYIDRYDNSHSDQLGQRLELYKSRMHEDQIFISLKQKADAFGEDYEKGIRLFRDYLDAYPDAAFRDGIEQEIVRREQLSKSKAVSTAESKLSALLERTNGRFSRKTDGVVIDSVTGLMWTLIDSSVAVPEKCLTYDATKAYVDHLDTGGYTDWRIPTVSELSGILAATPSFPFLEERWFWTTANYSGYSDGWYQIVETLSSAPNAIIVRRDSRECGTVRAVRGKQGS